MKLVVLDGYTENPGDLSWDALRQFGDLTVYDRTAESEVIERIAGADIVIEQRPGGEVTEQFFSSRKAPEGIGVYNPAFDVIPHTLVSAFITEKGVIRLG